MKTCAAEGCDRLTKRKFYCDKHVKRWKRHGDPLKSLISVDGEYKRCTANECDPRATHFCKTDSPLCPKHYARFQRLGSPNAPLTRIPRNRWIDTNGYVKLSYKGKFFAFEHRLAMEEYLGRSLVRGETVHHRNGVRHDNRLENLELWTIRQPPGQRVEDLVNWAREILARYENYSSP